MKNSLVEKSIDAYHSTNATFKKFDASFIGLGAGTSFGNGFYFSNEPIDEYGKAIKVTLNMDNPYEFDFNKDDEVIKFLEDCGCFENMYFYKGIHESDRKWSISKTLEENGEEDLEELKAKGYDALIIHNTPIGMKDKKIIDTEYLVWDSDKIEIKESLRESMLLEKTRQELINKSKSGAEYSKNNQARGKNRWERRNYSQVANSVRDYNDIDMDAFWKGDILEFKVKVKGETDNYLVTILFEGILAELRREVQGNNNKLEFKCVLRALLKVFNSGDVYVSCTCPDWTYRFKYWASRNNYSSAIPDQYTNMRPKPQGQGGAAGANDQDTKGSACKHVNLVISNLDWMMKIASVINNYVKWCKQNMERNYADYIFPQVYGVPYNKAIQLSLFDDPNDNGLLPSDQDTLNKVINKSLQGKDAQGKWTRGNQYRFQKKELDEPEENPNQLHLDLKYGDGRIKELVPNEEEK